MTQYEVLEFLKKNKGWHNAKQLRDGTDKDINIRCMLNKLHKLHRFGFIKRRTVARCKDDAPIGAPYLMEYKIK